MFAEADDLELKRATKLLLFIILGAGLAFGLMTSRPLQPSAPMALADPSPPKIPVSARSPSLRARAQMLSNLEHEITRYMSKHDDFQPGQDASKRSLLHQLPSAGSIPAAVVQDPNQPERPVPPVLRSFSAGGSIAEGPAPQRVILKLKESLESQKSSPSGSLAPQVQPDPFQQIREHYTLTEAKKVFPE
ncbi:MAG: hypothetical protein ACYTCV_09460, partial [Planctomycetota bacterium]